MHRSVVAQLPPGRSYAVPAVFVNELPERIDRLTVYVVAGPPPSAGSVPPNVVYDSPPVFQAAHDPPLPRGPVTAGQPLVARVAQTVVS